MKAKIETSAGTVEAELFPEFAPITANNFATLATSGFYNNLVWHRIVKGFVIQTGDPNSRNGQGGRSAWGTGGSEKKIPLEINPKLHHEVGTLGVARSTDPSSGSSQFFINLRDNFSLDGNYTVFGKVSSGMDAVNKIAQMPVEANDSPRDPTQAMLLSVTVV
jgi:cyclophilin family peptidyl-prolyl cis-trans isomerase